MKLLINKNIEITYHFLNDGETVFIDLFFVPIKLQGKGEGRKAFVKFLTLMHDDVTEIRLEAATNLTGRVNVFWEKLGFHYLYDIQEECFDEELLYTMTYPVKGNKPKIFLVRDSLEDEYNDYF